MLVILGFLIFVFYGESNGCSRSFPIKNTGKEFHGIAFFPLGHNRRLARFSTIQLLLNLN